MTITSSKKALNGISLVPDRLPMLPVRDVVVFPHMVLPLTVGRAKSIRALEASMAGASSPRLIAIVTQKKIQTEDPLPEDLFTIGTAAEILQLLKMPDGTLRILVEGRQRVAVKKYQWDSDRNFVELDVEGLSEDSLKTMETEALVRQVLDLFAHYGKLNRRLSLESSVSLASLEEPGHLCDVIASQLFIKTADKQELLEALPLQKRLELLAQILMSEIEILGLERKIHSRVRTQIEKSQKEYYLTEQMKAIQKELRQKDESTKELEEWRKSLADARLSAEAQEVCEKELSRLEKMMPFSPEATVIRTYVDWLIHLPWSVATPDNLDLGHAEEILRQDHFGLEKAKERILEYMAVCRLTKKMKGPILCFAGPPGVGKTTLARSMARALGRHFVRISLGGVRDESEIRGHRRTYIGSLPGRIIQSLRKAKSKNPVFLLDELDKMGQDWRGDPAAALLEVLDPEQNTHFADHYLDVGFDLSEILFITTANATSHIPPTLLDRLEVIPFSGYTLEEKLKIAEHHLIPKQILEHGLSSDSFAVEPDAVAQIIQSYTQEAGVRALERELAALSRKAAKEIVQDTVKAVRVTKKNLPGYLGIPKYFKEGIAANGLGMATGLAWTEHGGELLSIEVRMMPGRGKLTLTGKLGDVMKESAQAALSYVRSVAEQFGISSGFFKERDFHIHVPEGAIPKDGPSAGTALVTALASCVAQKYVKKNLAMTGEITLHGKVLPIGGFKEKILAAYRQNVKTVLYPEGNGKDLPEIPSYVQKKLALVPVKTLDDVLAHALEHYQKNTRKKENVIP